MIVRLFVLSSITASVGHGTGGVMKFCYLEGLWGDIFCSKKGGFFPTDWCPTSSCPIENSKNGKKISTDRCPSYHGVLSDVVNRVKVCFGRLDKLFSSESS